MISTSSATARGSFSLWRAASNDGAPRQLDAAPLDREAERFFAASPVCLPERSGICAGRRLGRAMKDIFTSYIAQAIALIANFVGGVLAARLLLPVGRGELGQAMLWPVLIAGLGGLSVGDAIIFFTASRRAAAPRVMGSALGMGAISSLALIPVGFGDSSPS